MRLNSSMLVRYKIAVRKRVIKTALLHCPVKQEKKIKLKEFSFVLKKTINFFEINACIYR